MHPIISCFMLILLAGCYPYYDKDPFILDRCPHIYFSGNQPSFQHKKVRGKLVLTVARGYLLLL